MGYRSDVTCIMYAVDPDTRMTSKGGMQVINQWVKQRLPEDGLKLCFDFEDDMIIFTARDWKWYEDYADIQMLERLFKEFRATFCTECDNEYHIEFMRFGENETDVTYWGSDDNHRRLSLSRQIRIEGIDD